MIHLQRPTDSWPTISISQVENRRRQTLVCSCGRDIFVQVVIWWFDQAGVGRARERKREKERVCEREKEREISAAHHFTWHPHLVTFWTDCTAARSGTVRLPLQSASYCNTPPHLCPSCIFPSVPFSAVAAVVVVSVVFLDVLPTSLLPPLPSARSASSSTLYLYRPSCCSHCLSGLWYVAARSSFPCAVSTWKLFVLFSL